MKLSGESQENPALTSDTGKRSKASSSSIVSAIVERDDDGATKMDTITPAPVVRQRSPKGNLYAAARGVRSETARRHLFQRQQRVDDVDNDVELGPVVNDDIQTLDE